MNAATLHRLQLTVQYATTRARLPHRRSIERCIRLALEKPASITVRFVDAREGRTLNRTYRQRDYATNVLTFAYAPPVQHGSCPLTERGGGLTGDIVLCASVVAREAREQKKELSAHYAHLLVHGVLHLQRYDHERPREAARMEARETQLLAQLGYADPYR